MIRPLKQTDYTVVKHLSQSVFAASEEPYFREAWLLRTNASLGYWQSGALLGATLCTPGKLEYIFVHGDYRGSGIGTQLLHATLKQCPTLYLVPVDDPVVHRWYVKNGFRLSQHQESYRVYVRHTHNLRKR